MLKAHYHMALNSPKHLLNVQDERLNYVKKDPHIIQEGFEDLDTKLER